MVHRTLLLAVTAVAAVAAQEMPSHCPDYGGYAYSPHMPLTEGKYRMPYQRPEKDCRTFNLTEVEETIASMKHLVKDPDLFRLFENCFPNTLDTAITWKGIANNTDLIEEEELTYITTGDINAMWLRDSANQLQSYKSLLKANNSRSSLASLFRGAINLQARYIISSPHCNAFQAPPESNLTVGTGYGGGDIVSPPLAWNTVHECKYELDSLAAFLQLSHDYFAATGDVAFFASHRWDVAVDIVLATAAELLAGTYSDDGRVATPPYRFQRSSSQASETLTNNGAGNPVKGGTGMVRSAFRPSDDACIYQLFVPANMMFSRYLAGCAPIMRGIGNHRQAQKMTDFAESIRVGIERHARFKHPVYGDMYAYEVDGFGGINAMDDANIPSLLSAPMLGYVNRSDPVYQNTRRFVLSRDNPYYMHGPVINATGGPHIGPGMAWPMGLIVRIFTSDDDDEIVASLQQLVSSTNGLGLMHESISSHNQQMWTRQWFSWVNGLFGQMLLDLRDRKPHLLATSFQK